jgi:hypothetical protein
MLGEFFDPTGSHDAWAFRAGSSRDRARSG